MNFNTLVDTVQADPRVDDAIASALSVMGVAYAIGALIHGVPETLLAAGFAYENEDGALKPTAKLYEAGLPVALQLFPGAIETFANLIDIAKDHLGDAADAAALTIDELAQRLLEDIQEDAHV